MFVNLVLFLVWLLGLSEGITGDSVIVDIFFFFKLVCVGFLC